MKKTELVRSLRDSGFKKIREGGGHEIWFKAGYGIILVARHSKDIPTGTLSSILKRAGIDINPVKSKRSK